MLFATLDLDLLEDPAFRALEDEQPGGLCWFLRLVQFAKRYKGSKGRVLRADGTPILPWMLSISHHGTKKMAEEWAAFLDLCVELELLVWLDDERTYKIRNWKRWHRPPSAMPEAVAERKAKSRNKLRTQPRDTSFPPRDGTDVTTQSRAEQSITEQSKTKQSSAEQPREREEGAGPPVTPPADSFKSLGDKAVETARAVGWKPDADQAAKLRQAVEHHASEQGEAIAADAAREAIRQTLDKQCNEKVSSPVGMMLKLLDDHIAGARVHQRKNRDAAERGKTATPYRWVKPPEWATSPTLEADFYLAQTPLAADLAALPKPRSPAADPGPQELSPDVASMIAAMASRKAIE